MVSVLLWLVNNVETREDLRVGEKNLEQEGM